MQELAGTSYLLLPLLGGAVFHGLCMKYGWLGFLTRPLDAGRSWRGKPVFGRNKTWRGLFAVGLGAAVILGLQAEVLHDVGWFSSLELFDYGSVNGWALGFVTGALAMAAELPNSFLKRRAGIGPGSAATGATRALFFFLDQVDLLVGFWIALAWVVPVTLLRVVLSIAVVFAAHQVVTLTAYRLGMRSTRR